MTDMSLLDINAELIWPITIPVLKLINTAYVGERSV